MGQKNTVMLAIDARTGKILQQFDLNKDYKHFLLASKKLGPGTIFLGRNGKSFLLDMLCVVYLFINRIQSAYL